MRLRSTCFLLVALAMPAWAIPARAGDPEGLWRTADQRGVIRIAPCDGQHHTRLCGWVVGLNYKPGENPPQTYQHHSQCGFNLIRGLRQTGPNFWNGDIVNPEDGNLYHSTARVDAADRLQLRGYIGLPIFGRTTSWLRYQGAVTADCHTP